MQLTREAAAPEQIAKLRQQVAQYELAAMRNALALSELQGKLAAKEDENERLQTQVKALEDATPAEEIVKLKREWMHTQKTLQMEQHERRAEAVKLRAQVHQAQRQLEEEQRSRRMEGAHASATISQLERDVSGLQDELLRREEGDKNSGKRLRRYAAVALFAFAAVLAVAYRWRGAETTANAEAPHQPRSLPGTVVSTPRGRDLTRSLSNLNQALAAFPNRTPESVLREIPVCSFEWNGGEPSLIFNGRAGGPSLSSTVSRCAEAVEAYAQERK